MEDYALKNHLLYIKIKNDIIHISLIKEKSEI